ncbi:hypothetical protein BS50DRAFT_310030 [Corynespora cassiicola Philippines]|uniref:Uncharacterized protein n=1 Tax=Corynespora cassiicola Philippines TaxID=1448308 RepID=A0A2T2NY03_CORCC|nr:hypothetical protein BS50DRAFT_310030 [Corynespora cassiicola Philippines]
MGPWHVLSGGCASASRKGGQIKGRDGRVNIVEMAHPRLHDGAGPYPRQQTHAPEQPSLAQLFASPRLALPAHSHCALALLHATPGDPHRRFVFSGCHIRLHCASAKPGATAITFRRPPRAPHVRPPLPRPLWAPTFFCEACERQAALPFT